MPCYARAIAIAASTTDAAASAIATRVVRAAVEPAVWLRALADSRTSTDAAPEPPAGAHCGRAAGAVAVLRSLPDDVLAEVIRLGGWPGPEAGPAALSGTGGTQRKKAFNVM